MIWGWEKPFFFCLSGSVLLLLLIYLLKYRGKIFYTQALFLWDEKDSAEKSSAGITWRHLPLSFYLEFSAIMLMVCGGAGFFALEKEKFPAAVILLNDSYSMNSETRARGAAAVKKYLREFSGRRVIWALCGDAPEILSRGQKDFEFEKYWKGESSQCRVPAAVSWAKRNFPDAEICLVTDRVPADWSPEEITLLCCGVPGKNLAVVNSAVKGNRVLLEIENFSDSEVQALLKVNSVTVEKFTAAGNGRKLFNFTLEHPAEILKFTIEAPGDALEYDNEVTLIDPVREKVTYDFRALTAGETQSLEKVLAGNPEFRRSKENAEVLFTAYAPEKESFSGHRVFFHRGKKSVFERTPPFFMPQERLLAGLTNTSLVWAFFPELRLPGRGVIFAGETVLASVELRRERKYDIHLNLVPEHSNLSLLPFWPGFFCNLAEFCRRNRSGVAEPNVKSGEIICFNTSSGAEKLYFRSRAVSGELAAADGKCVFQLKKCGVYTLSDGKKKTLIAVNPHVTDVSDLRKNRSFTASASRKLQGSESRSSKAWLFTVSALLLLTLNHFLCRRGR